MHQISREHGNPLHRPMAASLEGRASRPTASNEGPSLYARALKIFIGDEHPARLTL